MKTRPARAETPSPCAPQGGLYSVDLVGAEPLLLERLRQACRRSSALSLQCSESMPPARGRFTARLVPASTLLAAADPNRLRAGAELLVAWGPAQLLPGCYLAGCDEYLKDPWTPEELEWRLRRLAPEPRRQYVFPWGVFRLEPLRLSCRRGVVPLSWPETRILRLLADHPSQVVPREALYYAIWGREARGRSRVADVHVSRLRRKLQGLFPASAGALRAVRGKGYVLG